mmetsp:Transcript_20489/g.44720  ORF Transcript_20489/g.44720 Transcript_20489/m.44720 type:complete len:252 (+) Transcript_20489:405-1160(+)
MRGCGCDCGVFQLLPQNGRRLLKLSQPRLPEQFDLSDFLLRLLELPLPGFPRLRKPLAPAGPLLSCAPRCNRCFLGCQQLLGLGLTRGLLPSLSHRLRGARLSLSLLGTVVLVTAPLEECVVLSARCHVDLLPPLREGCLPLLSLYRRLALEPGCQLRVATLQLIYLSSSSLESLRQHRLFCLELAICGCLLSLQPGHAFVQALVQRGPLGVQSPELFGPLFEDLRALLVPLAGGRCLLSLLSRCHLGLLL